ncbi:MAG: hypothetical protein ABIN04_13390 [Ginsengibacter sp.]
MNEFNNIQTQLFRDLQQKLSQDTLPANEIASLLKISRSEAYNKISGKSQLTLSQLYQVCLKFNLHFEIGQKKEVNSCRVGYTPFHSGNISVSDYIILLNQFLENLSTQQVTKLSCATDDIPFFHLFKYPELAAFKLHFWDSRISKAGVNKPEKIFDFKNVNKKEIRNALKIHKTYLTIPSLEIWTKSYLLITPDQIKYAFESKLIKDAKLGEVICDQLLATLADIETYAIDRSKNKKTGVPFEWYQCDVVGSVTFLADTPEKQYSFLRFNTFNNFQTEDAQLCKEVEMWLLSLLNNSTGFSGHGSRQRNLYLHHARKTIERLKEGF